MGNQVSIKRKRSPVKKATKDNNQPQESLSSSHASDTTSDSHPHFNSYETATIIENTIMGQYNESVHEIHYLLKHVFQKNCMAPVDTLLTARGAQCLDIGCGPTATWMIDMANEYPNAHFTGIDILDFDYLNASSTDEDNNVVLPRHVPANCQFKQVDVLQSIDLPTASFDHVFQRFMFNVYPMDGSMQHKFKELAGLVKPGGYMEFIEPDTMPRRAGPKYTLLAGVFNEKMKSPNDQVIFQGLNIKKCLLDAGLEDVRSDYTSVPICWGGYVGKMLYESALPILSKVGEILWPYLGMEGDYDEKVYLEFVDSCFNECVEYKTYLNFYWAYGRRPLDDVNKET